MEDSDLSITNIRDFLTELPKLAKCEYSETTSYLLWKTLNLRLKHSDNGYKLALSRFNTQF